MAADSMVEASRDSDTYGHVVEQRQRGRGEGMDAMLGRVREGLAMLVWPARARLGARYLPARTPPVYPLAYVSALSNSKATTGSSPTTQASWPGSIT